jgi:hypothetical protein
MVCGSLSTISRLYCGGRSYWYRKPEYPQKTTDLSQVTDKFDYIMLYWEFKTLVEIGTDFTGSCKSNYYTITTMKIGTKLRDWTLMFDRDSKTA